MQDCLQVVPLPRILAVKQLQELDGTRRRQGDVRQEVIEAFQQGQKIGVTHLLTCRTNFWSMYFLAMLGWNS